MKVWRFLWRLAAYQPWRYLFHSLFIGLFYLFPLLPGLIDLHVHLGSPELERGQRLSGWQLPGVVLDQLRFVPRTRRSLLEHGVTSVRSLGDEHAWVMEMRRLLRDGELEGPRLHAAGPLFTTRGGHPVVTLGVQPDSDSVRTPSTPAEARQTCATWPRAPTRST